MKSGENLKKEKFQSVIRNINSTKKLLSDQ